jgi:ribonuclease T1
LRQRLELFNPIRYHCGFWIQGFPVFFSGGPPWWQALRKTGQVVTFACAVLVAGAAQAADAGTAALAQLPAEAQTTHRLILAGGPFPYRKDGTVFGNRERALPTKPRGFYHEYTVPTPGSHDRGAQRIVCGGEQPTKPDACFYTGDHYATFQRIVP